MCHLVIFGALLTAILPLFGYGDCAFHKMKMTFNGFGLFGFLIAEMVGTFYFYIYHHDSAFTDKPSRPRKTLIMQSVMHVFVVKLRI